MLKIGDKVKVRNDLEANKFYGDIPFTKHMDRFKGKEVVILEVFPKENNSFNITFYKIEDSVACWAEEMFESIEENSMPKLESGMFIKNAFGHYGVIAGEKIIYHNGGYDILSRAIARDGFIKQVIENNCGFNNLSNGKVIWEYKEKKEEKPKTYLEDFLEGHPRYKINNNVLDDVCAGYCYGFNCPIRVSCKDCWNAPKGTWE